MECSVLHTHNVVLKFQYTATAAPPYKKYLNPKYLLRCGYLVPEECATSS